MSKKVFEDTSDSDTRQLIYINLDDQMLNLEKILIPVIEGNG